MKTTLLALAACSAISCIANPVSFPLEWNASYCTAVPYEVEIQPQKLQQQLGVAVGTGFAVCAHTAQGEKDLALTTLPGRVKGAVRLRFAVPKGTTALTCKAGVGMRNDAAATATDNLFTGALTAGALKKWRCPAGVTAQMLPTGGVALRGSEYGSYIVRYSVDVPPALRGKPVAFELDVTSRTKMTWGGQIRLDQVDAQGKVLPEAVTDIRWTGHMRPQDIFIPYREKGRLHPEVQHVTLSIEMRGAQKAFDEYGLPLTDKDALMPKLDVTHVALRPAAELPFPKYNDSFFAAGVSGAQDDYAFNFKGPHGFWYQTRSWASWAQATQLRKEEYLFFPSAAGTMEAWFKADAFGKEGRYTLLAARHHQADIARGSAYKESRADVCSLFWYPSSQYLVLTIKDSDDVEFTKSIKVSLPTGRWFHLAACWQPDGEARVFLDGQPVMAFPLKGFKPYDLIKAKRPNDYQCTEFYFGSHPNSTRMADFPKPAHPIFPGVGDLLRVSTGVRYTAAFTPAKSFACDAATRALFTFDRSYDGISGGGIGWIPGTVWALEPRVELRLTVNGKWVNYFPPEIVQENDPDVVLNRLNYPTLPTVDEFHAARIARTFTTRVKPGEKFEVTAKGPVYPDFIEYQNDSAVPLVYPLVINQGEIDPRSFGDIADSLNVGQRSERERANAVFNFVLSASDYFMSHQSICGDWSDRPHSVEYEALVMLNSYCGFECGPLNNLAANMFAASGRLPASQTGGYGHSFEEVFFDGKNHIYDLSAQKFFPAMDNETAAYLEEDDNEPGIHSRLGAGALSFIRNGNRGHWVQTPSFQPKVAMSLNPGERFKVWFANDGTVNDIQHNTRYCGNRRVDFHIAKRVENGKKPYKEFQYECSKETGLKPTGHDDIHVVDNFFPHYGNGFLVFDGTPAATNPAFTNITADSFCYLVRSCYPVVGGEYAVTLKDGSSAPIEISTNRKDFDEVGRGKALVDYRIRSRNVFYVRVKAPLAQVTRFAAATEVMVNPRILPGKIKSGTNTFTFKATRGNGARVKVAWREGAQPIVISGGLYAGTIPGYERQLVLLDPAQPLALKVTGASAQATVRTHNGIAATLKAGTLTLTAGTAKDQSLAAVEIVDGAAIKELTVIVSANARFLSAEQAQLSGGATLVRQDAQNVQSAVYFTDPKQKARFDFAPLPKGEYVLFTDARFESHPANAPGNLHVAILGASFTGPKGYIGVASPANDATCFYKAHYGHKGGRANWHWEFPNEPLSEYPYHLMRYLPLDNASHLEYGLLAMRPNGVELAGTLILPAPTRAFKRELMKVLCGLNCTPWRVTK